MTTQTYITIGAIIIATLAAWAAGWLDWVWPLILAASGAEGARCVRESATRRPEPDTSTAADDLEDEIDESAESEAVPSDDELIDDYEELAR